MYMQKEEKMCLNHKFNTIKIYYDWNSSHIFRMKCNMSLRLCSHFKLIRKQTTYVKRII